MPDHEYDACPSCGYEGSRNIYECNNCGFQGCWDRYGGGCWLNNRSVRNVGRTVVGEELDMSEKGLNRWP